MIDTAVGAFSRVVAVRMPPGTDFLSGLTEACRMHGIKNGVIVSAIGSLNGATYCDVVELPGTKAGFGYGETLHITGPIELTGASGIICHEADGELSPHVHITMSDRYGNAHGGHLKEGTPVLLTLDAVIAEVGGIDMTRSLDEQLEVPIFSPKQL